MIKRLTRIGNSRAVIIDRAILELLGIPEDAEFVELKTDGESLTIRRADEDAAVMEAHERVMKRHGRTLAKLAK
jgi:antitoxin component of MazEF toxin-antitoxin module